MFKVVLVLLAANVIFLLWSQGDFLSAGPTSGKPAEQIEGVAEIITLAELQVTVPETPVATSEPDPQITHDETDKDKLVDQVAEGVTAEVNDSPSFIDTVVSAAAESDIPEKLAESVGEAVSFAADVVEDLADTNEAEPLCFALGPFSNKELVELANQQLVRHRIQVSMKNSERYESKGFWVFIPSDSLSSAQSQIEDLKALGISDVALVTSSGVRHSVSLGVYSTRERALSRQAVLEDIGFYTRVQERSLKIPQYWIDIRLAPEQDIALLNSIVRSDWPELKDSFCR